MAAPSALLQGLSYALCTLCGLGIVLNILVAVVTMVNKHLRKNRSFRYVRYGTLLMALVNLATGTGTLLVMLWPDYQSSAFCDTGSFLMLFGIVESMALLLVCCTTLLIQMKIAVKGQGQVCGPEHRWSFPIFLLSMLLKAVILAMMVFLALTKTDLFKDSDTACHVVRVLGEANWTYAAAVVILGWIFIIPSLVLSFCNIFVYGNKLVTSACQSNNKYSPTTAIKYTSKQRFSHRMGVVYLILCLLWIIVLMISTIIIFSGTSFMSVDYVNLALGYSFTLATAFGAAGIVVVLIQSRRWRHIPGVTSQTGKEFLKGNPPSSLASLTKLPQHKDEVRKYHVQWQDRAGQLSSGVMKVYHPACLRKWRAEVTAIARVSCASHPNIAQYMWESHRNKFAPAVCTFTGDLLSPECSVTCMQHYPHGTLGGYLKTRSHMTEVGLHKVTLDVARGLGYIHQNHLVHNGLTTETVYMASLSGKIGLRAVIGDFENSYEVSEDTLRKSPLTFERPYVLDSCSVGSLYSISQQMDLDNNKFAPDIRSFGMVVLEMLIALGEFDEHSGMGIPHRSKDTKRNSIYDNTSLASSQSQPVMRKHIVPPGSFPRQLEIMGSDPQLNHHHHHDGRSRCKCSPRVTDLRAARQGSTDSQLHQTSDSEQIPHETTLAQSNSAFTSIRSLNDPTEGKKDNVLTPKRSPRSTRARQSKMSHRRMSEIQNRDLPPVPPRNGTKSSPKKTKTSHRPRCDIIRPAMCDVTSSSPTSDSSTGQQMSLTIDDLSDAPSSQNFDFSPSSDEFYTLSVGSLGSFETIYEDEERSSTKGAHPHYQNTSSMRNGAKVVSGKPPIFKRRTQDEMTQKKRSSISSANESVFSTDSGVGSYASDTYSDAYSNRIHPRGRKGMESPDNTYYLKIRKQPCCKSHPEPGHICSSDTGFSTGGPTDSSASNTDTLSSDEPTYESIGKRLNSNPRNIPASKSKVGDRTSIMASSSESLKFPLKDLVTNGPHPVIKQQYRFAVPRLGISAVLARRLSDASLSSLNSHRSTDLAGSYKDIRKSANNLAMSSKTSVPGGKQYASDQCVKDKVDSSTSLSSSIMSIIQDSNALLESSTDIGARQESSTRNVSRFSKGSTPGSSKPALTKSQMNQVNELSKLSKFLDLVSLEPKEKARMLNMLKLISRNDRLGFIGHQLMSLFSDCWLEDPVPSADEILKRLNLVLPSASV